MLSTSKFDAPLPVDCRRTLSLLVALLASTSGIWAQPSPNAEALHELLDRVRMSAMRYKGHLPDFNCTESTVRKEPSGTSWRTVDTFEELVSFAADGRVTKKLVKLNGRPTKKSTPGGIVENLVLAGAIVPSGIFGDTAQASFVWDHWETRADHRIAVIAYKAVGFNYPDGKTRYELKVSGRIFYDDTAGNLIRTESSSVGPPGYPFGETQAETDYATVVLSDRALILPTSSVMTITRGKKRHRNEYQFSSYSKYDAGATISFDDVR
jgi:hypothetical protein